MPVERELWNRTFSRGAIPAFLCPKCKKGRLGAAASELKVVEPKYSARVHDSEGWEPDWVVERFSIILRCSISECDERVCVIGDSVIEEINDGEFGYGLESMLRPTGMFPAPPVILMPSATPIKIVEQLELSFQVLWTDSGACATKLRTSLERLLDHYNIQRFRIQPHKTPGKPGKRKPLELSSRIDKFFANTSTVLEASTFHALRVIGNLGTHNTAPSRSAILDAYEIYEHALNELFGQKKKEIAKMVKKIISKKGKY